MQQIRSIVIAGMSGGSGKSVATVALVAALQGEGYVVAPFKKGPDYIDAGWLSAAAGRPCYNLDPFLMEPAVVRASFYKHLAGADFAVMEGNRGLYDGVNPEGGFSTAELALQLDVPVILVVNCSKTTRTVAAMVLGCRELDPRIRIAGVLLNQIATPRHESIVRQSVEKYTGIPVVGIVPRMKKDVFPMRHLGITPHQEHTGVASILSGLAALARENFDLAKIRTLMQPFDGEQQRDAIKPAKRDSASQVKIGVLRDAAFQFYYEENLEALRSEGAELVMINALEENKLPDDIDALYIGGGFPETSAQELANNEGFRDSVRKRALEGLPIYAECGGLIFLGKKIILEGNEYPLAGVFPVTFGLSKKPQAHGYSIFTVEQDNPFYEKSTVVKGHEFRYSTVDEYDGDSKNLCLQMERGTGFLNSRDGLTIKNVLALYTHVLAPATPQWAPGLVRAAAVYNGRKRCL